MNINEEIEDLPSELKNKTTSLKIINKNSIQREPLLATILNELDQLIDSVDYNYILNEWMKNCSHLDENIKFKDENNILTYEERAKVFIPPSFIYPSPSYLKLSKAQNERKIDVFFSGRVGAYRSYRRDSLLYLIENGVCGYINFFNAEGNLDIIEYYRMLWNSKIAINFSYSTKGHQLKGRATDAISLGAMLLESENHQIACYFEDGEDYVSFSSKEDLLEKIDYYLKNSEERIRIAENGMRKIEKCYNPKIYWNSILKKIDENIY